MVAIYAILIAFILIEIYFIDPTFWNKKRNDKPWSTLVYVLEVFIIVLFTNWLSIIFAIATRVSLFDPLLNISGKLPSGRRDICYHPEKKKPVKLWKDNGWPLKEVILGNIEYYSDLFSYYYEAFWRKFKCWQELSIRVFVLLIPFLYVLFKPLN